MFARGSNLQVVAECLYSRLPAEGVVLSLHQIVNESALCTGGASEQLAPGESVGGGANRRRRELLSHAHWAAQLRPQVVDVIPTHRIMAASMRFVWCSVIGGASDERRLVGVAMIGWRARLLRRPVPGNGEQTATATSAPLAAVFAQLRPATCCCGAAR